MRATHTGVQDSGMTHWADRIGDAVTGPDEELEDEELEVARLSLDIATGDNDWLERFAAYRNALRRVQGKKQKKKWSRKSLAEHFLRLQTRAMQAQISEMVDALGPIPPAPENAEDTKALEEMEKYARRVLAWRKKTES